MRILSTYLFRAVNLSVTMRQYLIGVAIDAITLPVFDRRLHGRRWSERMACSGLSKLGFQAPKTEAFVL